MLIIKNDFYTIEVNSRKDGYYTCYYRIFNDQDRCLRESSGLKIMQRLIYSLSLYKTDFNKSAEYVLFNDLKSIAKKLNLLEDRVDNLISKYW